jgi:tRNA pseudouridine38-40 synthase
LRYFIKLAYNGTHYHGWQTQPNATSVQETLSKAISVILNTAIALTGAGRTDTGVHASMMYAHFDFDAPFDISSTVHKLNSYLPPAIVVYAIIPVHDDAHARFDAKKRTYQYHIHTLKNPFLENQSWFLKQPLDLDLMNEASQLLLKYTNFQCFSKVNTDVNTFDCSIFEARWTRGTAKQVADKQENDPIVFTISANRFLRNMVRSIVGTLVNVGFHKTTIAEFIAIIESKNRSEAGVSVPAHGLFLTNIEYDYLDN